MVITTNNLPCPPTSSQHYLISCIWAGRSSDIWLTLTDSTLRACIITTLIIITNIISLLFHIHLHLLCESPTFHPPIKMEHDSIKCLTFFPHVSSLYVHHSCNMQYRTNVLDLITIVFVEPIFAITHKAFPHLAAIFSLIWQSLKSQITVHFSVTSHPKSTNQDSWLSIKICDQISFS